MTGQAWFVIIHLSPRNIVFFFQCSSLTLWMWHIKIELRLIFHSLQKVPIDSVWRMNHSYLKLITRASNGGSHRSSIATKAFLYLSKKLLKPLSSIIWMEFYPSFSSLVFLYANLEWWILCILQEKLHVWH